MTLSVSAKRVVETVTGEGNNVRIRNVSQQKKTGHSLKGHVKGHVSGHASVHHVSCGMLLGRSWCFLGDGSSCHSDDNRVLCTQGEEC